MNNNDEKVREYLEHPEVPEELSPENIKVMLDEKAPAIKRKSGISMAGRLTAVAAACAVIVGGTFGASKIFMSRDNKQPLTQSDTDRKDGSSNNTGEQSPETATSAVHFTEEQKNAPYMAGAESYEQIYKLMEKSWNSGTKNFYYGAETVIGIEEDIADAPAADGIGSGMNSIVGGMGNGSADDNIYIPDIPAPTAEPDPTAPTAEPATEAATEAHTDAVSPTEPTVPETTEPTTEETTEDTTDTEEHSDTHNQEENVLEADIVKTDGKYIYYVYNNENYIDDFDSLSSTYYSVPTLNIAEVSKGKFVEHTKLCLDPQIFRESDDWENQFRVQDMYLYNDMIAVVGSVDSSCEVEREDEYGTYYDYIYDPECFVSFYTKGAHPELIGTYRQDGYYEDIRISPDGYMYLVTDYSSCNFDSIDSFDDIERYIPQYGVGETECIHPDDILLPNDDLDNGSFLSYTVIGSIDLNTAGEFSPCEVKALAGYTGNLYSSANNLYAAVGWSDTSITRIAIGNGVIAPEASCKVKGYVNDQFSMSEYNGYFRVATTVNEWETNSNFLTDLLDIPTNSEHIHENRLYVFDMDLNEVGSLTGFGENENIRSVRFSGNMAYVVTFMQTDPLFAIDLNDPENPVITDEYKITGYSSYMQQWDEGHLLGFGEEATEDGMTYGIKLTMFDNSDPYDLKETGLYVVTDGEGYVSSEALWDRKALLIAPEKNIICVPIDVYKYLLDNEDRGIWKYMFFSYNGSEFELKGTVTQRMYDEDGDYCGSENCLNRAVYIGDYIYVLSGNAFVSVDMETFETVDEISFR